MKPTPHTAAPGRRASRVAGALIAAGALAVLTACGTSVLDLEVGQCIANQSDGDVSTVPVVECTEPHSGEIYALPQLPDGEFPGVPALQDQAGMLCAGPEFQSYVGVPHAQSGINFSALYPSEDTWSDGDREIVCLLANQDGTDSTGSLRGANR